MPNGHDLRVQSSSDLPDHSGEPVFVRSYDLSDDTVNRMMHLAYGEHKFEIGGMVLPPINRITRPTVNRDLVNRMMTVVDIFCISEFNGRQESGQCTGL